MKKTLLITLTLLMIIVSSCKKEEIKEPPKTPIDVNGDCNGNVGVTIEVIGERVLTTKISYKSPTPPYTYLWNTGSTSGIIGSYNDLLDYGTYWVTLTDGEGCYSSDTFTIYEPLATIENEIECVNNQSAFIDITIVFDENTTLTEKGVCYSTNPNPTLDDDKIINLEPLILTGYSNFESEIISLNNSTQYYARGYGITSAGIAYGEELTFTTQSTAPTLHLGDNYQGGIIYKLDCKGLHGAVALDYEVGGGMTWLSAKTYCSNLNVGGYSWTLPKSNEIGMLREHLYIGGLYGLSTSTSLYSSYWTNTYISTGSTTCSSYITYAFNMNQDDGYELNACYSVKFRPIHYF